MENGISNVCRVVSDSFKANYHIGKDKADFYTAYSFGQTFYLLILVINLHLIYIIFHVVIDLERIGDHAINILENAEKRSQLNEKFTGAGKEELTTMYTEVLQLFDKSMESASGSS